MRTGNQCAHALAGLWHPFCIPTRPTSQRLATPGFAMPITVVTDDSACAKQRELGTAEQVFITNGVLHIPGHSPVASYHRGWWRTRSGEPSACLVLQGRTELWFEQGNTRSESYGPFSEVRIVGGGISSGDQELAHYDEQWKTWSVSSDGSSWPDVVFRSAPT